MAEAKAPAKGTTRGVGIPNQQTGLEAEAPSERRTEAIKNYNNQPNKRGAMVQQEVVAPGRGTTRGGGRPVRRST